MAKGARSFGQGIGGMYRREYSGDRRERERERVGEQTASLKGGLVLSTTTDPYRSSSRKAKGTQGRQSMGCPAHAYDEGGEGGTASTTGTSIFDPVLCEVVYSWFAPPGGHILDPFAGESTKGIVAAHLGYGYTGVELRPEQVAANRAQAEAIGVSPNWINGDSERIGEYLPPDTAYDLIFTSPPYYDLEIYSESDKDGSAFETYDKFIAWYRRIFAQSVGRLKDNRFVVVKIGEVRDKRGAYYNFVGDNITCFRDLGLHYYNEIILVTARGSLPIRVGKQFTTSRKIGKTHQNVLVFYKGDPRRIRDHFPADVRVADLEGSGEGDPGEPDC